MEKEIDMKVITGLTRVRWSSAMGILEGTVKRVDTAKNAAGDWIEWRAPSHGAPSPNNLTRIPRAALPHQSMLLL